MIEGHSFRISRI